MENLTQNERMKLMVVLRMNFDANSNHEEDCQILISISKKLELDAWYIREMESDLKCG